MGTGIYLLPLGLVAGREADRLIGEGEALRLAGGPFAFTGGRLIEGAPGATRERYLAARALSAARDPDLRALVARVTGPRPAFAGLALDEPRLMGIVNVTPDSFSDGGAHADAAAAIAHGEKLIADGADILDIGGESTRPGADAVSLEEERARIVPVLRGLAGRGVPLSIDTRKAAIMREATRLGATIINDVSALAHDAESPGAAAESGAFVVLMHSRGDPKSMQENPSYADAALEVHDELAGRIAAAGAAGIAQERIAADPGLGFAKSFAHNLAILERLALFHGLGVPLLVGASRKGFIGHVTGVREAGARVAGSVGAALAAAGQGAQMLRVHDVAETRLALAAWRRAGGMGG